MILFVKNDGRARPFEWLLGLWRWLHDIDFPCPLLELAVRGVQRCTPVNAQGVSSPLKLLLTGFFFISSITFTITNFFLSTPGGFSLVSKGLAGAIYFTTPTLAASGILTFLFVTLLILCSLSLNKLLNLIALLKIMAFGPMNLAIRLITFPGLL